MEKIDASHKAESFEIFNSIAPTYDLLNRALSMGIDQRWRNKFNKNLPNKNNLKVLDLATGTADVALTLAKDLRVGKVVGIDLSEGMISLGRKKIAKDKNGHKIELQIGDGVEIPFEDESFDVITVAFGIRNFPDHVRSLHNMFRVLKPGGVVMVMEFGMPNNPIVSGSYKFYFRHLLPTIGNIVSGHKNAYTYLNKTVEDFPYGNDFTQLMKNAGFIDIQDNRLSYGIAHLYRGVKK